MVVYKVMVVVLGVVWRLVCLSWSYVLVLDFWGGLDLVVCLVFCDRWGCVKSCVCEIFW